VIKTINILRWIKKYAIQLSVILIAFYTSIATYDIFVNYENYQYTHDLKEYILHKTTIEAPLAKSNAHKFINSVLSSSNYLNGFSESDAIVISESTNYIHPFDNVDKFNILKELVIQNLLFNMPSTERHNFIMNHRLMDIHKIFNRFYLNNIPIITNNNNKESLIFSLIVKSEPDIIETLIES
jgi:hypothetical protein